MLKKNMTVEAKITDYTDDGAGVGKVAVGDDTFTLFIKDTAVGDVVRANVTKLAKSYGYGRLVEVLVASPDRADSVCPVAKSCGGCCFRHIRYEAQLLWKERRVSDCLRRIGGLEAGVDFELQPIIGMDEPSRYRNKAQYPVGVRDGRVVSGFYAGRTHSVIASEDCLIEPVIFSDILSRVRGFADGHGISVYDEKSGEGLLRHVLLREGQGGAEVMVCLVVNAPPGDRRLDVFSGLVNVLEEFRCVKTVLLSHNTARTNVILGSAETILLGDGHICDCIGVNVYEISAKSFYQVNPVQTEVLYEKALEFAGLTGDEVVWDLYCGTGTISLFLARSAGKVYGVEVVPEAVEDARRNARRNGIKNAAFYCGKSEDIVIYDTEEVNVADGGICLERPDVVVVDPPRKGCDERLIETVGRSGARRLVYVSCNPATFARDAARLSECGYRLKRLQPVDMFPHTSGVECVGKFDKGISDRGRFSV